nr:ABC transporter B family member 9-like [Ipomoea batatas]
MSTEDGEKSRKTFDQKGAEDQSVPLFKLFSFADRFDIAVMIIGTGAAMANGFAQPFMSIIFGELINSFAMVDQSHVVHTVSKVCFDFVCLSIYAGIASVLQMLCWTIIGERQAARMRGLYLKAILRQDIAFFDTEMSTGEVIGRMSGDIILIQQTMGVKVGKFIQYISTFLGSFIIAFIKGRLLSLVLYSCLSAYAIPGGIMALINSKVSSRMRVVYSRAANVVGPTIGAIRMVASFSGEKQAIDKYNNNIKIAYRYKILQGLASGGGAGALLLVVFSTYGLAFWYGSRLILDKGYNGRDVVSALAAIMIGGMALDQISSYLSAFAAGQVAAYKIFETINRTPQIDAFDMRGIELDDMIGEIELRDVYFRYPARPDVQIFSGLSMHIPNCQTVALVGQSGSGKSSVISLLERFYDPDAGEVLIDGINIKRFKLKWLREKIGLVSQEPILFATTLKENIAYGKENATDLEIRTALQIANAANFIDELPKGLDTMVGEHGMQLSDEQKQRVAIARAILKNPKILLLDEATSALDLESEQMVQDALNNLISNRTTVVIAHRLTTIRNADLIAVLQSGKLVEQGTHDELMQDSNGAYTKLVQMQQESKQKHNTQQVVSLERGRTMMDSDEFTWSSSERISAAMRRSVSFSSSRHSITFGYVIPGLINIWEPETRNDCENEEEAYENSREEQKITSIKRLAALNRPELPCLVLGVIVACIQGAIYPVFGFIISMAIKALFEPPSKMIKDSRFWALMCLSLGLVTFLVLPIQNFFFGIAGGKLIQRIRSFAFKKVIYQDISWFDDPTNSSDAVWARLSTDASTVRCLVGDALALLVQSIATALSGLIIAFHANWALALIIVCVLPLMFADLLVQTWLSSGSSVDPKVMYKEASQIASEAIGGIRTVASFCAEEKVMAVYLKKCEVPVTQGVHAGIINGVGFAFGSLAFYLANAFFFYIGAVLIQHDKAAFSEVLTVFYAMTMLGLGVSQAYAMAPDVSKAKDSAASIFAMLDRRPKIDSSSKQGKTFPIVWGEIEFDHVSFKYPTRPDIQIFKDLNLKIPSGKVCALVGESGSGKSTVISLIERFYDPESGAVLLDGVPLRELKLSWLRQQMGLVSRDSILFNETVRDNIAYGKQGTVTEDEIVKAAKMANAHRFICSLPRSYDTRVGERGAQLSDGQKQRIAIARAILKNPEILLLDDVTSGLEPVCEDMVQEALDRVMGNRTTVMVVHRLATVRRAHSIAVIKNGVIAEEGSHEVLMNIENGVYASLVSHHIGTA